MAKLICSTDWHLKFSSQFDRMTDEGIPSRLHEIIQSVNWTIELGKKEKCEIYAGAGDIFDTAEKLNTKEGIAIKKMFDNLSSSFKNSFFIPGNHDQITSEINILELFSNSITVFSKPSFRDIKGARIFFLPYMREAEDIKKAIDYFKTNLSTPDKKYLFAHFWDKNVMPFDPEAIEIEDLGLDFFDRVFLGHYHVPTSDVKNKIVYLGTLLNKRFNETGPKGCWIIDLCKNDIKFHANPNSPEFIKCLDEAIISEPEMILPHGYYKVYTSPENVTTMTKLLGKSKGFELLSKDSLLTEGSSKISLEAVEKKNSSSFKDFILNNCSHFLPDGVDEETFKARGKELLSGF